MASRKLGRPPAIDSAETRQRLVLAARRVFARLGYDATTNREIAAEAGITTGAIYHYFASKAELFVAVFAEVQDEVYAEFEKAAAAHERFADRLDAVLDAAADLNASDPSLAAFVAAVPGEADRHPDLAALLAPLQERGRTFVRKLVDDACERGELAAGADRQAVTDMVAAVLTGLARYSTVIGADRHRAASAALKGLVDGTLIVRPRRGTTRAR